MRRSGYIFLFLLLALISCDKRSSFPPVGSYSDIVIVTESGALDKLTELLVREIQHPIDYYTKEELQFRAKLVSAYELEKQPPTKNMILFGVVRQGEIGSIIEGFIGTASVRAVLEGKSNILKKLDYPSVGCLTLIVTASTSDRLRQVVEGNGQLIRDIIEEANRERLRAYLLQKEQKELSEELRARYKFILRIPFLYEVNQQRPEIPGVEVVRVKPHRGITVSWRRMDERISLADSSGLYDIRADLAWKMYDKDVMRRNLVSFSEDRLGDLPAIRMDGYWENSVEQYGGPFSCFFVYDDLRSKLWIVDTLVYGPGFDKHPLLRELRAVAETFEPI